MVKRTLDYDILDCPVGEPIVFTGPPGKLTARLPVRNNGDDRAVLRHATVSGDVLDADTPAAVRTTVLRPQSATTLRTRVSVASHTPPGDYPCELDVAGSVRPAVLRVVETISVRIEPSVLFIENVPGSRPTKRVLVTNRSNVPVTVGQPGGIALDDERGECRVTRATYEALGSELSEAENGARGDDFEPGLTFERAFGEWVKQGRNHLASMGVLGVRNADQCTVIAAGDQASVTFRFRIPKNLDQHSRYIGSYPIYNTDLAFIIVPGGGSKGDEEEK